jgi:cobalt/nickel transport protein
MKSKLRINIILIAAAIFIIVLPLLYVKESGFSGADGKATDIITENNPGYKPWFKSPWTPPGQETESMLFALQAALGAGITGWVIGFYMGRKKKDSSKPECM